MLEGVTREPVEQAFAPPELGEQHHSDQEKIDVHAARNRGESIGDRDQRAKHEDNSARSGPPGFGPLPWTRDHTQNGKGSDRPGRDMTEIAHSAGRRSDAKKIQIKTDGTAKPPRIKNADSYP